MVFFRLFFVLKLLGFLLLVGQAHALGPCGEQLIDEAVKEQRVLDLKTRFKIGKRKTISLEDVFRRYANLVLKTGISLQDSDGLYITGNGEHFGGAFGLSFADILEEEAQKLRAGIKVFKDPYFGEHGNLRAVESADPRHVSKLPAKLYDDISRNPEKWTYVRLGPSESTPASIEGTSTLDFLTGPQRQAIEQILKKRISKELPWVLVDLPTLAWARRMFTHTELDDYEKLYRSWETLIAILGLQHANPAAHWAKINKTAIHRSKTLNSLNLERLHFYSDDGKTDLSIEIVTEAGWECSAENRSQSGRPFMANIPSVEVWATPNKFKVNGRMQTSRSVVVNGKLVEGLWFEFKNGRVKKFGAKRNKAVIGALLEAYPEFNYLGEIALVGVDSPLFQLNMLFANILMDENAGSHAALGSSYGNKLQHLPLVEKVIRGMNQGKVHIDFTFGSAQMNVDGFQESSELPIAIQRSGAFTAPFNLQ